MEHVKAVASPVHLENGSWVEIKDGMLRIWDRSRRLLAKVNRGSNCLYVLHV
jgi:uncharacterized protein YraI